MPVLKIKRNGIWEELCGSSISDGLSIFYASIEIEHEESDDTTILAATYIARAMISTNGRTIQVGDLIITSNGTICSVTDVSSSSQVKVKTLASVNGGDAIQTILTNDEIDEICDEFVIDGITDVTDAIDQVYLKKSGDIMSGNLHMGGCKITGIATPTASTDAVNKEYVDNISFSGEGTDGISPTVSVSKSGDITTLEITDVNGTKTVTINDGEDGISPTVSVSKSGKVATIEITDVNGTKTVTINDGEDGIGEVSSDNKYTPQMFGAVGDGVVDDTSAMNNWFEYLAENNVNGYIPNGTYLVTGSIGYSPSSPSGKQISFVGESASQTIIKANFTSGTIIDFRNCYLGEFGNLTINNNESAVNDDGVTGFQLVNMQYTENAFSYIHDINIINIGRRAALIYNTAGAGTKSIKYVNMERVNIIGLTSDRTAWGQYAPVGIIVSDTSHFHFVNCTAKNINCYPLEFKNYTEYCSHENCIIEHCGHGIYLGQQISDVDAIGHLYYKAIGNIIKDVPVGIEASKIAHSTFDNNTIIGLDEDDAARGLVFTAPCEYITGSGNNYYGDKYAVYFKNSSGESYCHDNVIELAVYKTTFSQPYVFETDCQRCGVIATNYQTIATTKITDENNNVFIPIVNTLLSLS